MANTTFNTRIQNKIDTYENYNTVKDSFIPLKGEVCIATVSTQVDGVQSPPQTLIKIGDGKSTWGSLKWLSATAADVADSLKGSNPTLPATSITGLNDYISGQIQDTNTLYRLVASGDMGIQLQSKEKGEEDTAFKNVGSPIVLTAPTYSLIPGDTNGTVKFGVTGSEKEVKVHGLQSGAYTDIATLALAEVSCGATEVIGSIKQENGIVTATKKTLAEADIPKIPTSKVTNLDTTLAGKQDTLTFNTPYNASSNKAATMTDVQNAVSGLANAMHYVGESTTNPSTGTATVEGHEDWAAGDVVTYQSKEYVYDGENWRELGDESSFAIKGSIVDADIAANANIAQSKIAGLETALAGKAGTDVTDGLSSRLDTAEGEIDDLQASVGQIDTKISTAIGALDKADSAVANQFVNSVSEENGVITVTRAQPEISNVNGLQAALDLKANDSEISTVGKTGNITDLIANGTIILNCGSSSKVID